jgi:hypothetical protein
MFEPLEDRRLLTIGFSSPTALNTNAGDDYFPHLATDGAGHWVAVWRSLDDLGGTIGSDWDILTARSEDNGATWTDPVALNTNAATDSGNDDNPQVATDGNGHWVAVWESPDDLGGTIGTDYDILVARSDDNGATWSAPAPLNTSAGPKLWADNMPSITTDGTGHWPLGGGVGVGRPSRGNNRI